MRKSIFSLVLACLFISVQAEEMWHLVGTNDYARKQCLEKINIWTDSLTGADYYFHNLPQNPGEADLDSLYFMVFDRLAQTGSVIPAGNGDISSMDESSTSFYRATWALNEYPADGGWWIWSDPGVTELQQCQWEENPTMIQGAYMRLLYNLHVQNTYLSIAEGLDIRPQERAQVRFVRALTAWYLLDLFPASHFSTQPGIDANIVLSRQELYSWLEYELQELTTLLPTQRENVNKVDQTAAYLLLARLYLNAEVYTGTAQWQKASEYAKRAMEGSYQLHKSGKGIYSPYQELFMGDNDTNGAAEEIVFAIKQDGLTARSWGGAMFAVSMTRNYGMPSWCTSDSWQCWRAGYRLLQAFASEEQLASVKGTEFTMPAELSDDRALFYADDNYPTPSLYSGSGSFNKTWSVNKFTNRYSVDPMDGSACSGSSNSWPDTDLPLMRIAEAYMTYAEAQFRMGDTQGALDILNNNIRARANAEPLASLTLDVLLDEWQREFHSEGRRRVDLIRFHQFASPEATRTWEGHENITDESLNSYPTPDILAQYPRFDGKVRYYAAMIPTQSEWNPDKGTQCDSCNTGEAYYDSETGAVYSVNSHNVGLGGGGFFRNNMSPINTDDTLQLELAQFPHMQSVYTDPLPEVTPQDGAFTIMLHCDESYGTQWVVLGDYLNQDGKWIYSETRNRPTSHEYTGTKLNNQSFVRMEAVGNGWYKAVVYPIAEKDENAQALLPGYAHITGIAAYEEGSSTAPQILKHIHKAGGVVADYTERSTGEIEFNFSQLATYEDPTYGRVYYSSMLTDRVVYLFVESGK